METHSPPQLFGILMIPLSYRRRKWTGDCKFRKSQEKIDFLMYRDNIKLFTKNKKELDTLIQKIRIYSQEIGMEFGINICPKLIMKSGKRETKWIELPTLERIRTLGEKGFSGWPSITVTNFIYLLLLLKRSTFVTGIFIHQRNIRC